MKKKTLILLALGGMFLFSCKSDEPGQENGGGQSGGSSGEATAITYSPSVDLSTDKACYSPGETVKFTAEGSIPSGAKIRYRHLGKTVSEVEASGDSWTWVAPATDYVGYMVDVYKPGEDSETIYGVIAVDVSSDWKRFPRYGFVADFGEKSSAVIAQEMEYLNRCHINGVQFQDWHNKHHWPLGSTKAGTILEKYKDIANRDVYTATVKGYIEAQHAYGMKSIFYNLCYGVLDDAESDGVKRDWFLYKDYLCNTRDSHDLPDSWKSDIYLVNPGNREWQDYLIARNTDVYDNLGFDGYQIDQLGNRGTLFDANGREIDMTGGYESFIKAMKAAHPDKRLIMNAVSRYGTDKIVASGGVDFLYNEVWSGDEAKFSHLKTIIDENTSYSNGSLNTVFAAYMNYNLADREGKFNNPGVLLADAVMFALGGSHLELGDHMLCKEYFPNKNLGMDTELKNSIINYYDFLTAYQNVLRDGGKLSTSVSVKPGDSKMRIQAWPPVTGSVCTIARSYDDRDVVHLLNFTQANSTDWRDADGSMPRPRKIASPSCQIAVSREVKSVWMASPDIAGGAVHELAYTVQNGMLEVTLPSLLYWDMIVVEYK